MTDSSGEAIGYRELLGVSRSRYPALREAIDEAENVVPAGQVLADAWIRDHIRPGLPIRPTGQRLVMRVALFATLATQRGVQLSESLVRELAANSLFGCSAIARAQLELVGLTALAREELESLTGDAATLEQATARLLFAARSLPTGERNYVISDLIDAAKRQLGEHFGADYGYLSDLSHPNAIAVFGSHLIIDPNLGALQVSEERAELLVKVAGQGLHAILHNTLRLVEWAMAHDTLLVPTPTAE